MYVVLCILTFADVFAYVHVSARCRVGVCAYAHVCACLRMRTFFLLVVNE